MRYINRVRRLRVNFITEYSRLEKFGLQSPGKNYTHKYYNYII